MVSVGLSTPLGELQAHQLHSSSFLAVSMRQQPLSPYWPHPSALTLPYLLGSFSSLSLTHLR